MSSLKEILINKNITCKSIWFMRQAGRYLPEFRKIRDQNKDFIKLCLNSALSSEITLQPIKRFNLDSAIIFSDILLIPYASGQDVTFLKNKGPKLGEFNLKKFLNRDLDIFIKNLDPVYKAINQARKKLDKKKSLIGFVGAPWTLLVYMLNLKEKDNRISLSKINSKKNNLDLILTKLNEFICLHIQKQIEAGADVIQIFDSWAGEIPEPELNSFCYLPNQKIVKFCKLNKIPVICFPKGIKENYANFNKIIEPDGLSIDYDIDPCWAAKNLTNVVLQGGLHPKFLSESDEKMYVETKKYLDAFKDVPYIFNLGHGLRPETDPEKLSKLIKFVRTYT